MRGKRFEVPTAVPLCQTSYLVLKNRYPVEKHSTWPTHHDGCTSLHDQACHNCGGGGGGGACNRSAYSRRTGASIHAQHSHIPCTKNRACGRPRKTGAGK